MDINDINNFNIIFMATEFYFKAKALMIDDLPKPSDWIFNPKENNDKWESKKKELIATDNFDKKTPLIVYMEIMSRWVKNHH